MNRYFGPIKWLGGIAIVLFILSFVFGNIIMPALPEATRNSVLTHAVPFFAAFVGILLLFILLIVLVALRFNGKIPNLTYENIEKLIVAGILFGVICLFNPWSFVPYRYGFGLLLISTLAFILWSHVAPPRAAFEETVEPISTVGHVAGVVIGLALMVLVITSAVATNEPRAPYGIRERVWNSYSEERRAEIATAATTDFNQVELPFLVLFSLFPGAAGYLFGRELIGGRGRKAAQQSALAAAGGD
jgi:hypothetical protein